MTLLYRGFDGPTYQYDQLYFARYLELLGQVGNKHGVVSGFDVTPGSAGQLTISTGAGVLPGLLVEGVSNTTVNYDPNTGTSRPRTDYVILRADWNAQTVVPAVVKNRSATDPGLTQNVIDSQKWEMPLARFTLPANTATVTSADIEACKPLSLELLSREFETSVDTASTPNLNDRQIATINVPDPGRPYALDISTAMSIRGDDGYGISHIDVNGSQVQAARSGLINEGSKAPLNYGCKTAALTGPSVVRLWLTREPVRITTGTQLTILGGKLYARRILS